MVFKFIEQILAIDFQFQAHFLLWHFWQQCGIYVLSVVKVGTYSYIANVYEVANKKSTF